MNLSNMAAVVSIVLVATGCGGGSEDGESTGEDTAEIRTSLCPSSVEASVVPAELRTVFPEIRDRADYAFARSVAKQLSAGSRRTIQGTLRKKSAGKCHYETRDGVFPRFVLHTRDGKNLIRFSQMVGMKEVFVEGSLQSVAKTGLTFAGNSGRYFMEVPNPVFDEFDDVSDAVGPHWVTLGTAAIRSAR